MTPLTRCINRCKRDSCKWSRTSIKHWSTINEVYQWTSVLRTCYMNIHHTRMKSSPKVSFVSNWGPWPHAVCSKPEPYISLKQLELWLIELYHTLSVLQRSISDITSPDDVLCLISASCIQENLNKRWIGLLDMCLVALHSDNLRCLDMKTLTGAHTLSPNVKTHTSSYLQKFAKKEHTVIKKRPQTW